MLQIMSAIDGARDEVQGADPVPHDWPKEVAMLMGCYPNLRIEDIPNLEIAQFNALVENAPDVMKARGSNALS